MQKITPNLWFDHQAEAAVQFYLSVFKNSKIKGMTHYGEEVAKVAQMPAGSVLTIAFELDGQDFVALNGGPVFQFTHAISFIVHCNSQEEVDDYYEKLSRGGEQESCGWLKDKYGLSWQIVPTILPELLQDKDPKKVERVTSAMLQMHKIEIEKLKEAAEG